jgi:hypothetical protein
MRLPTRIQAILIATLLSGCATSTPIQRYSESKSKFTNGVPLMSHNYPDKDLYRVYVQGATGYVPISALREHVEDRADKFCERQGKRMVVLGERISQPPYIFGNFPRIEIVFACIDKPKSQ